MLCATCDAFDISALYHYAAEAIRTTKPRVPGGGGYPDFCGTYDFYCHYPNLRSLFFAAENGCDLCSGIWSQCSENMAPETARGAQSLSEGELDEQIYLGLSNWSPLDKGCHISQSPNFWTVEPSVTSPHSRHMSIRARRLQVLRVSLGGLIRYGLDYRDACRVHKSLCTMPFPPSLRLYIDMPILYELFSRRLQARSFWTKGCFQYLMPALSRSQIDCRPSNPSILRGSPPFGSAASRGLQQHQMETLGCCIFHSTNSLYTSSIPSTRDKRSSLGEWWDAALVCPRWNGWKKKDD